MRHTSAKDRAALFHQEFARARELEVLVLVSRGLSNARIVSRLYLSEVTVKRHLANVYPKLGVASRGEALSTAMKEGWITERDIASASG